MHFIQAYLKLEVGSGDWEADCGLGRPGWERDA